jgi:regulation of enolase protein 1 (concanavalin A-like superfamily)
MASHANLVATTTILATLLGCGSSSAPPATPTADGGALPDDGAAGDDAPFARDLPPFERSPPTPSPPPGSAWKTSELGDGAMMTSRVQLGSTLALRGGGRDIGGAADSFVLHAVRIQGDGQIVAHLRSVQAADPHSTAGVMIRGSDSDPAAAEVFYGMLGDPALGAQYVVRSQSGAAAVASAPDAQVRNQFLRISRRGRQFTISRSSDRLAWIRVAAVEVDMPDQVAVGLAVAARSPTGPATGEFDFVSTLGLDAATAAQPWDLDPLGNTLPAPVATVAGGSVTINALGDGFTTASESGAALLSPRSGDTTITARIEALGPPNARIALTFREGTPARLSATARNVLISVRSNGLLELQRRDRSTNFDPGMSKAGVTLPVWLRLARRDDLGAGTTTITGWYSSDGQAWTRLDAFSFAAPDPIMTGVIYSSGSTGSYGTAQLSGFAVTAGAPPPDPDAGAEPDAAGGQ